MRSLTMIMPVVAAAGCTMPAAAPVMAPDLALFGGYRSADDMCQRAGETAFTNAYLDHTADLVACPQGYENTHLFEHETGALLVAETQTHRLYSVPRR